MLIEYIFRMSSACDSASEKTLTSVEMWAHDAHRSWPRLRRTQRLSISTTEPQELAVGTGTPRKTSSSTTVLTKKKWPPAEGRAEFWHL